VKKLFILCFLFFGCVYAPHYSLVKDSYNTNTYAPVYAPTHTETYAPVNNAPSQTRKTYPAYTVKPRQVRKYRPVIVRRIQ